MGLLDRVLRRGLSGLWHTYAGSASCWVGVIHASLLIISVSSRNLTVLRREVTVVWETPGASNRYLVPEPRL